MGGLYVRQRMLPDPEPAENPPRKKRRRWLFLGVGIVLAVSALAFQSLVTAYCWFTETPRTQFRRSSKMRAPIRTLFANWETTDDVTGSHAAKSLVAMIERELPIGSTVNEVDDHIRSHYRRGVRIFDWTWSRSDSNGYIFPWMDVKIVEACWNPRDFLEGGSVTVNYVTLEGEYLRTEIRFVGWKGHPHPQIIKIVALEEPNNREQDGGGQPATRSESK